MNHGGKRENSGRKSMSEEQKRKPIKYYLNEKERHAVNAFVAKLKYNINVNNDKAV